MTGSGPGPGRSADQNAQDPPPRMAQDPRAEAGWGDSTPNTTEVRTPLEHALAYVDRGWAVMPLFGILASRGCACRRADCTRPGKHPLLRRGVHEASTDPALVDAWWRRWPAANVGIATGAVSGLVVIDIDRPGGEASRALLEEQLGPLPPTLTATTGGGGLHLLYRHPGGRLRNVVGGLPGFVGDLPHIDCRADGGSIVAAPSRHVSGASYSWVDWRVDPAPAPAWLRDRPRTPAVVIPPESRGPGSTTGYGRAALARELRQLARVEHGENDALNRAAFALGTLVGGGELAQADVEEALTETGRALGLQPGEIARTISSGIEAGIRRPRVAPHRTAMRTE